MKVSRSISILLIAIIAMGIIPGLACAQPQNVIILIGDGMGPEQVKAGHLFNGGPLSFETAPHQGTVTTFSANNAVTDSAASATAIATGVKVNNGVISTEIPGDRDPLETTLEFYKRRGKSIGLVTSVYVTHATPAGFGAHEKTRENYEEIGQDYLTQTRPNVLFGGGYHMKDLDVEELGYTLVRTKTELEAVDWSRVTHINGQFGLTDDALPYESEGGYEEKDLPHLSELAASALDILDDDPDGLFLMIEGGKIDWACHANNIERAVPEVIEFAKTVQVVLDWAKDRDDTLIIVTADHETGGLSVTKDNGAGKLPDVEWDTEDHSVTDVPIYAWGPNAEMVKGKINNIDISKISRAAVALQMTAN